jgi:uncharacterized membrane protein YagU involved in acid resistance
MNYVLMFVGALLALISYRWSFYYKCNPNYYVLLGRSAQTQTILEFVWNIIFFGGYLLIILSSGFNLLRIIVNVIIVVLLHVIIFPIMARTWLKRWI